MLSNSNSKPAIEDPNKLAIKSRSSSKKGLKEGEQEPRAISKPSSISASSPNLDVLNEQTRIKKQVV